MLKVIAAIIVAVVITDATVAPTFSGGIEPTVPQRALKGDRLTIDSIAPGCSETGWPYYQGACVRAETPYVPSRDVRIIAIDRLPTKPLAVASIN